MITPGHGFVGREIGFEQARRLCVWRDCLIPDSAVGHEVTAKILTLALGAEVPFARVNLKLKHGDHLVVIVPNFRATEAGEFTREEVEAAGFRCFEVQIYDPIKPRYEAIGQINDSGGSLVNLGCYHTIEGAMAAIQNAVTEPELTGSAIYDWQSFGPVIKKV